MTTIYLLRHGQYQTHDHIVPYRLPGFHLSPKGIADAEKLAQKLSSKPIAAVYTSPLERTLETATILATPHGLAPIIDQRLLETKSPAQGEIEAFLDSMGGWHIFESTWYKENDGEPIDAIVARMRAFIEEVRQKHIGKEMIVVSHGDPIMLTVAYYQGTALEPSALASIPYVPMAGGYQIDFDDRKATIQAL